MKKIAAIILFMLFAITSFGYDERPLVPANAIVQVRFQVKSVNSKTWSTGSTTLKGAISESMMANAISNHYQNSEVRILAAYYKKNIHVFVRYQVSHNNGKTWSNGTTTLTNALTESMARNQLMQRYPNSHVKLLGMSSK